MADDMAARKLAYARVLYEKGVKAPAKIQQAVKKKFGTGMNFRDLANVFPGKPGAKKKVAAKRGPGRPRKKAGRRPGRPKGWSSDQWLLLADDGFEVFGSRGKLQARVAELVAEGFSTDRITLYEKTSMRLNLRTTVTL